MRYETRRHPATIHSLLSEVQLLSPHCRHILIVTRMFPLHPTQEKLTSLAENILHVLFLITGKTQLHVYLKLKI